MMKQGYLLNGLRWAIGKSIKDSEANSLSSQLLQYVGGNVV